MLFGQGGFPQMACWGRNILFCIFAVSAHTAPETAAAQDIEEPTAQEAAVVLRQRTGLDPQGVTLGAFRLLPVLNASVSYDDNIYDRRSPDIADTYLRLNPKLELDSLWSRHGLRLTVDGDARRYLDTPSENSDQFGVNALGRIDIAPDLRLNLNGSFARRTENRGSAGDVFLGPGPNIYYQKALGVGVTATPGPLLFNLNASTTRFDYRDAVGPAGPIDLSSRAYITSTLNARAGYEVAPRIYAFASGSLNRSRYPNSQSSGRGSNGYSVGGGLRFDLGELLGGEVRLDYMNQDFASPLYSDVSGLGYSASIFWNPTTLLSVQVQAARILERAPLVDVSAVDQNSLQVTADYELLRRLLISASLQRVRSTFRGIDRIEDRYVETVTARYNLSRFFDLTFSANLRQQSSPVSSRRYSAGQFGMGLIAKY